MRSLKWFTIHPAYRLDAVIWSGVVGGQNTEYKLRSSLWNDPVSGTLTSGNLPLGEVYITLPYIDCTCISIPLSCRESTKSSSSGELAKTPRFCSIQSQLVRSELFSYCPIRAHLNPASNIRVHHQRFQGR